ncbi:MAG: CMP-binding protein [Firmicutes bacterium]|nr:CMP-binding protein [Bacillota bacterium]
MAEEKNIFVEDFKSGMEITTFLMVKAASLKIDSRKREYVDFTLADRSGEVNAKKWDVTAEEKPHLSEIKEGDIIKVKAQVSEWQGQTQLRILRVRKSTSADGLDMNDFIKSAPEPSEDMYQFIMDVAESLKDEDFKKVSLTLLERNKDRLMYYPAAAKNHHAEYGGLLWHMKRMLMSGDALCGVYTFLNRDLVLTGVIIHDMEKLNEIDAGENGMATGYSFIGQLLGHIVQGTASMKSLGEELGIPYEKIVLLQHMILTHHYEPEYGSPKKPMFPEAELLHYLDIMDARMYDMEDAVSSVEKGAFSERVWTLDNRRIYKPTF